MDDPVPARAVNPSIVVQILTLFLLVVTVLAYLARVLTKLFVRRQFLEFDDYLITASLAFGIVQSSLVVLAAIRGLGLPEAQRTVEDSTAIQKLQYGSSILWFCSLCLSRLAYLSLVRAMTPKLRHRTQIRYCLTAIILWTMASIFVSAFQCGLPRPWMYLGGSCIDRPSWFITHDALDMVLDAALMTLPTIYIFSLQAGQTAKKFEAVFYFWIRIFVIAATICHTILWSRVRQSSDHIADIWPVTISAQVVQAFSIVTVSALYLKPLVKMLQTGFLRLDDAQRRGSMKNDSTRKDSAVLSFIRRTTRFAPRARGNGPSQTLGTLNEITAEPGQGTTWDRTSQDSTTAVIHTETTVHVESEPRQDFSNDPSTSWKEDLKAKPVAAHGR